MKIGLIQPPLEDFYTTPMRNLPLGLLSIAANLAGQEVQLLDWRYGKRQRLPVPAELRAVLPFYRSDDDSPFGLYKYYQRFGMTKAEITRLVPEDWDLFCIAAQFTTYADCVYEVIALIKEKNPHAKIVVGGHHATVLPAEVLAAGADFVVQGEGEAALPALVQALSRSATDFSHISNLVWRDENGVIRYNRREFIADLDTLPFPDYNLQGLPPYQIAGQPLAVLLTSRGCPYGCTFCGIHQTMGRRYRQRSVGRVLAEISSLYHRGYRWFDFEDDHLGGDKEWFRDLLVGISELIGEKGATFSAMNGITAASLDFEILQLMRRAGFRTLNLSLVTPHASRQRQIGRPVDTAHLLQVVELARQLGFEITVYLIIGLPGETAQETLTAIQMLADQPVLIGPSLHYLVPGTVLFTELEQQGLVPASRLQYRATYFPVETGSCSRLQAMTLLRICRLINFIKWLIGSNTNWELPTMRDELILLPEGVTAAQRRRLLGIALMRTLFKSGKLCGTRRVAKGIFAIVPEVTDQQLVEDFLNRAWSVKANLGSASITQDLLRQQIGC